MVGTRGSESTPSIIQYCFGRYSRLREYSFHHTRQLWKVLEAQRVFASSYYTALEGTRGSESTPSIILYSFGRYPVLREYLLHHTIQLWKVPQAQRVLAASYYTALEGTRCTESTCSIKLYSFGRYPRLREYLLHHTIQLWKVLEAQRVLAPSY